MTQDSKNYLRPETLAKIAKLEIRARWVVNGFLAGMHKSRHFGNSMEFRQHRAYVPGDELRSIDWKVWGRQDRWCVKQYDVDTNLRCTFLVDISRSMRYRGNIWSKYDYACTLAASLGHLLSQQQDAVGCLTFDKDFDRLLPPKTKKGYLNSIVSTLISTDPEERLSETELVRKHQKEWTDSKNASGSSAGSSALKSSSVDSSGSANEDGSELRKLLNVRELSEQFSTLQSSMKEVLRTTAEAIPKNGMVVVISDLLTDRADFFVGLRTLLARGHDVMVIHVLDDDEVDFAFGSPTRFNGLEIPFFLQCDPRMLQEGYLEAVKEYLEEVRKGCSHLHIDYTFCRTSSALDAVLTEFLAFRSAVRKKRRF